MAEIKLTNICKSFDNIAVIKGVDIDIHDGEFVVFVGPSGCGKSTLLRMIAGLEDISSGQLSIDGQEMSDIPAAKRGLAMVFQSYALYPHMNVFKNLSFGLKLAKVSAGEIKKRVHKAAQILQITDYLERLPKSLSGGQRQRVAIGRAIVREPRAFLFDEPLSNLDAALRSDMRIELADLRTKLKATIIYVTHDQVEAMTLADKIVVLNQGRVEQIGSPMELYKKPQTEFVAGFIGSPKMNFIDANLFKSFKAERVGIRPEHIKIVTKDADFKGQIRHIERLGSDTLIYADIGQNHLVLVRFADFYEGQVGDEIALKMQQENLHLFQSGKRI